jgi:AraC-like DNA-binding protein
MPSSCLMRAVFDELTARSIEEERALSTLRLRRDELEDPELRFPFAQLDAALCAAAAATREPRLGLSVGRRLHPHMLGLLGHLMLSSITLREALEWLLRDGSQLCGQWTLEEEDSSARLRFELPAGSELGRRLLAEIVGLFAAEVCRVVGGVQPHLVSFRHARPPYALDVEQRFDCLVRYDVSANAVVLPARALDRARLGMDRRTRDELRTILLRRQGPEAHPLALTPKLRTFLLQEGYFLRIPASLVAGHFGLSVRNLRRKLAGEGWTLTTLAGQLARDAARERIARGYSVKEVAKQLGYRDVTSFHRAFRRWTGQTPVEYRAVSRLMRPGEPPSGHGSASCRSSA